MENADGVLRDPKALLADTDWAALEHMSGSAADAPGRLAGLLDADDAVQAEALGYLYGALHHQNSIYSATPPAAVYVAAILADPRTTTLVKNGRTGQPWPLRADLLEWIASLANETDDTVEALKHRYGSSLTAQAVRIRALRPVLFEGVSVCFDDPDFDVREWAVVAACILLDDPGLVHHRTALVPRLRGVLESDADWLRRNVAITKLREWGEDVGSAKTTVETYGSRNPPDDGDLVLLDELPW
jgi:hypothetical protein